MFRSRGSVEKAKQWTEKKLFVEKGGGSSLILGLSLWFKLGLRFRWGVSSSAAGDDADDGGDADDD